MGVKIGMDKFDSIVEAARSKRASVLLIGPPKCGKTLFGMHFLHHGLRNDEYGIYVVTNSFPEEVVERFQEIGDVAEHLKAGRLKFLDCYTIHTGVQKESTVFILRVSGPTALTEIGIAISQIMKKMPAKIKGRVLFDSLSTFMLYNAPTTVANFVQSTTRKMKQAGASSVFILEEGMHDEKDVTMINSLLDSQVRFRKGGKGGEIDVAGFGFEGTVKYSLEGGKLIIS